MARPTRWDRRYKSADETTPQASYASELARLAPGETLTRVRFQYSLQRVLTTLPFGPDGLIWAVGIQVGTNTAIPTTNPIQNPNLDWIWWEGAAPRGQLGFINSANAQTTVASYAPVASDVRDAKAQRRNDSAVVQSVWLQARAQYQTGQSDMFFAWSASTLVIEAGP